MLLMAPEQRLSMHLKCLELHDRANELTHSAKAGADASAARAAADQCRGEARALQGVDGAPRIDLLDESDELLHHRCAQRSARKHCERGHSWATSQVGWWLCLPRKPFADPITSSPALTQPLPVASPTRLGSQASHAR